MSLSTPHCNEEILQFNTIVFRIKRSLIKYQTMAQ